MRDLSPAPTDRSSPTIPSRLQFLRLGVDSNAIRSWLGRFSVNKPNRYAEVNLQMNWRSLTAKETFLVLLIVAMLIASGLFQLFRYPGVQALIFNLCG
jgi:hypothetical protein